MYMNMSEETTWRFGTRKSLLVYWAVIPFMFLGLLMYVILKDSLENKLMYIVLYACMIALASANFLWLLKFPLIRLRDNKIVISPLLFTRKVLHVEYITSVSPKHWHTLIKLSNGDSVRFPTSWLVAAQRVQLESLLQQIVRNNQDRAGK